MKKCEECEQMTFDGEVCSNCGYDLVGITGTEEYSSDGYNDKISKIGMDIFE